MNRFKELSQPRRGHSPHPGLAPLVSAFSPRGRRQGFTLIELLVVSGISLILMTVGAAVYVKCLNIYQEGQGLTEIYQTARLINRDLRTTLAYVVPLKGEWVEPKCYKFDGGDVPAAESTSPVLLSSFYFPYNGHGYQFNNTKGYSYGEPQFSGPQLMMGYYGENYGFVGLPRKRWGGGETASSWRQLSGIIGDYGRLSEQNGCWWAPGFYGKRDGAVKVNLENFDIQVGSWGWPRPDYRMEADADDIKNKKLISNWFYCEDRDFNSPNSYALDNPNLVLASMKFSAWVLDGFEYTQLSLLKHHISGWDHSGKAGSLIRSDMAYGNMMRAIKVSAYHLDNGNLVEMDDAALGVEKATSKALAAVGATKFPRCFDVEYKLRNPKGLRDHVFARRFFCLSNPQ